MMPDEEAVKNRRDCAFPKNVDHLPSFLSFAKFYLESIADYATEVHPVLFLVRNYVNFRRSPEVQRDFEKISKDVSNAVFLALVINDGILSVT